MDAAYVKETLVLELSANRFRSLFTCSLGATAQYEFWSNIVYVQRKAIGKLRNGTPVSTELRWL